MSLSRALGRPSESSANSFGNWRARQRTVPRSESITTDSSPPRAFPHPVITSESATTSALLRSLSG